MPTVAELERLDALVSRLVPLTEIQRGELIRAQDWNTVVGALIEVLRAVLANETDGIVEAHEHPDQVDVGWLDPKLRSLIERGPLSDPASASKLAELDRRLQRQTERSETILTEQDSARERMAEITTRDLSRQSELTQLRRTVEGMVDAREEVLDLRTTLGEIEAEVRLAVEAAEKFTIGGQPVDMEAINERIAGLEILRERLTSPDGSLFDAGALEIRLTELTNTLVTEEELDEALNTVRDGLSESEREAIADAIHEELNGEMTAGDAAVRGEIDASAAALRGEFAAGDASLRDEIGTANSGLREEITAGDANLHGEIETASSTLRGEFEDAVGSLRSEVDSSATTLRGEIADAVQAGRDQVLTELERRMAELADTLRGESKQESESLRKEIAEAMQATRDQVLGELERRMAELAEALRKDISTELEQLQARFQEIAQDVVKEMLGDSLGPIFERLEDLTRRVEALEAQDREISRLIAILLQRIGSVDPSTGGGVPDILRDAQVQLDETVQAAVKKAVKSEVDKLNRRLPRLIQKQIDEQPGPG